MIKLNLPEKVDRRHRYVLVLDTETANTIQLESGLDMSNTLFYDCGFGVYDTHGRDYGVKCSFVNSDIFVHEQELMESAYYAKKIPQYKEGIADSSRILANTYEIRKAMLEVMNHFDIHIVCAHNARFDYNSLNNTQRWTTKSKWRYFLPYGVEWWDSLKMARSVMGKMPTYIKWCEKNGYTTATGKPRFTAEICYRFITKDLQFRESHTGLEDVEIEAEIMEYCHRQHKAMKKKLWER